MFVQTSFPNKLVQDKFFSSEQPNLWGQGGQGHTRPVQGLSKSATVKESRPEELDFADDVGNSYCSSWFLTDLGPLSSQVPDGCGADRQGVARPSFVLG